MACVCTVVVLLLLLCLVTVQDVAMPCRKGVPN